MKEEVLSFQIPLLEHSPSAQLCSSVSREQNGYYAAQDFLCVSEENVRRIQESFERSPCKSPRRGSRELGIPQPTVWCVLRCHLLFNWVHLFESLCITASSAHHKIRCLKAKALDQTPIPCSTLKPAALCKMTALVSKWHYCCGIVVLWILNCSLFSTSL